MIDFQVVLELEIVDNPVVPHCLETYAMAVVEIIE
jgi:hypothetical protein